jgi:predicted AAA+ superfamily ATPase
MARAKDKSLVDLVTRMAAALDRLAPSVPQSTNFRAADAFVWHADRSALEPVPRVNRVALPLLKAIDQVRDILLENTERFAAGLPANNALLWGARGMGKSSLVKAAHGEVAKHAKGRLKLVEIHREDIESLPRLMALLRGEKQLRFIVFCDDLSFDAEDTSYKSLKAALEGGIEGRPGNMIFYATSNRRHILPRDMVENERSTAVNPHEAVQEKVSLSDRFGLWLGFHNCSQDEYLAMVGGYADHYKLKVAPAELTAGAIECGWTRAVLAGTKRAVSRFAFPGRPRPFSTRIDIMHKFIIPGLSAFALISLLAMPAPAFAEMLKFKADLKSSEEVPPNDSPGAGTADVTLDTDANKVSWTITYENLTGDATAAHFHGPAKAGENAGPVVDISANTKEGSADVTAEQLQMIRDGNTYLNIHTAQYPDGEIRGQVTAAP